MTIQAGDRIPSAETLKVMGGNGPEGVTVDQLFGGKRVVLFALPGAFTPGCSKTHLPGYVVKADEIKAKGVDSIICMAVNDAFVMGAWGDNQNAENIIMLADGNAELSSAMGLDVDFSAHGMGTRCKRLAMIVDDGVISYLGVEPAGDISVSSAESILEQL